MKGMENEEKFLWYPYSMYGHLLVTIIFEGKSQQQARSINIEKGLNFIAKSIE